MKQLTDLERVRSYDKLCLCEYIFLLIYRSYDRPNSHRHRSGHQWCSE